MIITLYEHWEPGSQYIDPTDPQVQYVPWTGERYDFDTATLTVTHYPDLHYNQFNGQGFPDPQPDQILLPTTFEFYHFVLGPTRRGYFHNGFGGFTVDVQTLAATAVTTLCQCAGGHDGHIDVSVTGGPGPWTYAWDDGVSTEDRLDVAAGRHLVTITDTTTGQVLTQAFTVGENPPIVIVAQLSATGVDVLVNGGTAPFTYAWDDGPVTASRMGIAEGAYSVTVTDSLGCTNSKTIYFQTSRFFFSRNPVTLSLVANQLNLKPNLRFLCEVFIEEEYMSDNFVSVAGVLRQPADVLGRTVFDVSTLLDAYVRPDFPNFGESGVHLAGKAFKRFYLQYSEQWDGSAPPTYVQRDTYYLVYGGLDFFEYASNTYFTDYRPRVKPFLSWEPVSKEVFADQPEFLNYLHDRENDGYFQVQVTFIDSSNVRTPRVLATFDNVERFTIWRIGCGLPQLLAGLRPAPLDVVAWEVVVTSEAGVAFTETRYFTLDTERPRFVRYLLYANSVAGINTLACRGKRRREVDFESQLIERTLQATYLADEGETLTTSTTGRPMFKLNTGYRTPDEMEALQDFLLSEEVRYVDTDRYRPGSIEDQTGVPIDDDDEGLQTVEFSFVLPKLHRYTPALPLTS